MTFAPVQPRTPRTGVLSPFGGMNPGVFSADSLGDFSKYMVPPALAQEPDDAPEPTETSDPKRGGLFSRISNTPGASRALIALGAGLLSGRGFTDGLAKGATGYQEAMDTEADRRKPQVQFLAGGAVKATIDPITGQTTYERNDDVQNVIRDQLQDKTDQQLRALGYKFDRKGQELQVTEDGKDRRTAATIDGRIKTTGMSVDGRIKTTGMNNDTSLSVARMTQQSRDADRAQRAEQFIEKAPSPKASADYQDLYTQSAGFDGVIAQGADVISKIDSGDLDFGLVNNMIREGKAATGWGDPNDPSVINYTQYKQFTEQLRQNLMAAAKGPQTKSDAEQILRTIEQGRGDPSVIRAAITTALHRIDIARASADAGMRRLETDHHIGGGRKASPAPVTSGKTSKGITYKIVE